MLRQNLRNFPAFCSCNRPHARFNRTERNNLQRVSAFHDCTFQARIIKKKTLYFPKSRTGAVAKLFDIAASNRANPAPWSSQRCTGLHQYVFKVGFSGKKGARQRGNKRRDCAASRQQNAPTSLAVREDVCAGAQCPSRGGLPSFSRFPGVTPKRPNRIHRIRRAGLEHSAASRIIAAIRSGRIKTQALRPGFTSYRYVSST